MQTQQETCTLCPRRCGVVRDGRHGVCSMPQAPVVARAALHQWEEPCLSGTRGAGTVFFSGCTLRCVYCQNHVISGEGYGRTLTVDQLRACYQRLIAQGAHVIELVTPTHFLPAVIESLSPRLPVPVVYNCGGYETVESLRRLEGLVDIYLPDMKYALHEPAARYSAAPDYPEVADAAIREMYRQVGDCVYDADGLLQRGVIVRHLVLPGQVKNSFRVLDWYAQFMRGKRVLFSLMSQYTPCTDLSRFPELDRKLTEREYRFVEKYLYAKGIEEGYLQALDSASSVYIPPFDEQSLRELT